MDAINLGEYLEVTAESAAAHHLKKIREADIAGPENACCSTTEKIMVALALCNRSYLPKSLAKTHAGHLWWRLDDAQRTAIVLFGQHMGRGGDEASGDRRMTRTTASE